MEPKETFIPLSNWTKHFPWPTICGMRNRYRDRKKFGYESAFFKEGKRVIVRVKEFWKCLENRGDK